MKSILQALSIALSIVFLILSGRLWSTGERIIQKIDEPRIIWAAYHRDPVSLGIVYYGLSFIFFLVSVCLLIYVMFSEFRKKEISWGDWDD